MIVVIIVLCVYVLGDVTASLKNHWKPPFEPFVKGCTIVQSRLIINMISLFHSTGRVMCPVQFRNISVIV